MELLYHSYSLLGQLFKKILRKKFICKKFTGECSQTLNCEETGLDSMYLWSPEPQSKKLSYPDVAMLKRLSGKATKR
ncbi:SATB1-AS1 isoform 74 [Pan troglodytes]|uniref:SATB1-AS1 isoform 74 n=1 Tax=Pan troglodytes TaxID=9598 RepID=A0A2J8NPB9_PANTR|nr:SATB1-AS1 isoform 74 [Pan troglodytes]